MYDALDKIVTILQTKNIQKLNNNLNIDDNTLKALEFITELLRKMSPTLPMNKLSLYTQGQGTTHIPIPILPVMPAFNASQASNQQNQPPPINCDTVIILSVSPDQCNNVA